MAELAEEFQSAGFVDIYKTCGIKEAINKIGEFIELKKTEILLAWWAEHGFAAGNAALVYSGTGEMYIRESTPCERQAIDAIRLPFSAPSPPPPDGAPPEQPPDLPRTSD
jgi:hypothetical protein